MRKLIGTPVALCILMLCVAKVVSYFAFGLREIPGSWIIVMAVISLFVFVVDCALPADIAVEAVTDAVSETIQDQLGE